MKRAAHDENRAAIPLNADLETLRRLAANCHACDLWRRATQTVFGQGSATAALMLVGEQPGNSEDLEGKPFVGPAGKLLDRALEQAGIDPADAYITNVVKHFKWIARGKLRIHKKPDAGEIAACRPWLQAEIAAVHPKIIACLGASAAQALLGRNFRLTQHHGEFRPADGATLLTATIHPSAVLRAPTNADRHRLMEQLVSDLKEIAHHL